MTTGKPALYKTFKEIVDPAHTAIVVWDVQNALVNSSFNKDVFLGNLKPFLKAARDSKVPLVYTKITPLPAGYDSPWRLYMQMKRYNVDDPAKLPPFMRQGSPEAEIHAEAAPKDNEVVLNKYTTSVFIGTSFENLMRNAGVTTILFTGIATEIGIDSSARDASSRGFYTVVIEDCVSSSDEDLHKSALKTMKRVCLVASSKDVMKEWKT